MATVATVEGGKASGQTKIVAAKKQVIRMPMSRMMMRFRMMT